MYFLDNLLVSKFEITGNLGASLGGLEEMLRPAVHGVALAPFYCPAPERPTARLYTAHPRHP